MPESEERMLINAQKLDEEALTTIYDAFSSAIFRYSVRLLGNTEAAEDVVSETFFRLIRSIHAGGGPKKHLKAYLYRVAHNLIVDRYRQSTNAELDHGIEALMHAEGDEDPERQVEMLLAQIVVRKRLWMLTEDQRQVIVLKYFEGLTNQEVADVLGKPVGAVKSLQHRGLNALRRMFAKDESMRSYEDV